MSSVPLVIPDQLYCVLLSLRDETLLLPNAAVVEAVAQDALRPDGDGPQWLAGSFMWGNRRLPAVNFELLNGGIWEPMGRRARLIILHSVSGRAEDAPLAIVCQGYPHLITLSRVAVTPLPLRASDSREFVLARVRIGSTEAIIPDLEQLAAMLARERAQEAIS